VQGLLRRQAELAKRELSDHETATIEVPYKGTTVSWTLSRDTFEQISEPLLLRLRSPIERALRDARVRPTDLTRIIFAGGATRMPMFRRLIARLFQRLPVQHINPDEVVGRGAAVRAGMRMRDEGLKESVLTDVCPFTLGIETTDQDGRGRRIHGLFSPIIERNTIIPASRSKTFSTIDENQRAISIRVFQGEGRLSKDNILLGAFKVQVPPGPAGKESIDVRFTYDTSGLLEVEASVLSTKMRERIVIEGNAGVLSREQIKERLDSLAKLKVHPRDQAENMALIARAERLYEERLGVQRDQIGGWLTEFLSRVEDQDPLEIEHARSVLAERLDAVDDKFFL
jgi:molecular chaperone HscC